MGIIIRQSIFTTFFSYLGVVIGYINVLWLFPKFLEADEIGLVRVIQDIAILLVPFAQFGMSQTALKYFPLIQKSENNRGNFLTFFLIASIVSYIAFILIFFIFRPFILSIFVEKSPQIIHYFWLSLTLTFLLIVFGILESYSRSLLKTVFPNFIREVLLRLFSAFMVLFYFLNIVSFQGFLYLLICVYGLALISLALYLSIIKKLSFGFDFGFINKRLLKEILNYSFFTFMGSSGFLLVMKIDSIMITSLLGLKEAGIYTTVFYIAAVVEMPKRAIVQISVPIISKAFQNSNLKGIAQIYSQSSLNQLIIGGLIYIGIWANIENIFYFIPNKEIFEIGKSVVLIIGLAKLIDMSSGINGEIVIMSKYYKFNFISILLLSIVTIVANFWLIPIFGINGAAWASAFSIIIFNLAKFLFLKTSFNMQPFSKATVKVLLITFLTLFSSSFIPVSKYVIIDIIIRSLYIFSLFSFLIINYKISPEINSTYDTLSEKLKKLLANF